MRKRLAYGTAIVGCFVAAAASADQLDFSLSTTFESNDNLGLDSSSLGSTFISDTTLGATYTKDTPTSKLVLSGQGVLRYADLPNGQSSSGFEDPSVSLQYSRMFSGGDLSLDLRHRRTDLNFSDPLLGLNTSSQQNNISTSGGTLERNGFGLSFSTGQGAPLSMTTTLRYDEEDYQNTTDPALHDQKDSGFDTVLQYDFSNGTVGSLSFGASFLDTENTTQTERLTQYIQMGVTRRVAPATDLDIKVGYTDIETDETTGVRSETGLIGRVGLTRNLPNGSAWLAFDASRDSSGPRNEFRLGRVLQTARGNLDGNLGVSWSSSDNEQLVGQISYTETLRSGSFSVGLSRSVSVDDNSVDVTTTQLNLNYNHQINAISSLDFSFDFGSTEDSPGGSSTRREAQIFKAAYTHSLTQDWDLTGGYRHERFKDNATDAHSNAVFVTLSRQFQVRR